MHTEIKYGTCPVCEGTGQLPLTDYDKKWSWNKDRTHKQCYNCGGQTMGQKGYGQVRLNKEGQPCVHEYTSRTIGRCLTEYTCKHCGHKYEIDSGD